MLMTNVPPLLPAMVAPGATVHVPFVIDVTVSESCSASVSFATTPKGATTEIDVCGLAELTSTLAAGRTICDVRPTLDGIPNVEFAFDADGPRFVEMLVEILGR